MYIYLLVLSDGYHPVVHWVGTDYDLAKKTFRQIAASDDHNMEVISFYAVENNGKFLDYNKPETTHLMSRRNKMI
jgi:hypothetical protein